MTNNIKEKKQESLEVVNSLLAYDKLKIIQRKDMFNFSLDTVLLANFCSINKNVKRIIDFGTNNAAIPLLLSQRTNKDIVGIEIQEEAVVLAKKNILMNELQEQVTIIQGNIKEIDPLPKYQLILCNPPFFKLHEECNLNENELLTNARHEKLITLEEIVESARKVIDFNGKFAMVHRPERLQDILTLFKKYDIELKRLQFVYPKMNKEAKSLLIEGIYKGKPGLKVLPPIYAHNDDGSYSKEIQYMFGEKQDD